MSRESHGRFLRAAQRSVGKATDGYESLKTILLRAEAEEEAVRALVAFALRLAGTDRLPPPAPAPLPGEMRAIDVPEPPSHPPPPPAKNAPWTMDNRPGPHDLLTWEEAMQVPWYNPFPEPER